MNFSTWAIEKPVPTLLLFLALTFIGIFGFYKITVQDFPDIDFPTVTVTASLAGANPSQMETEVTRKIEDSIASVDKIQHISSTVSEGSSITTVTFDLEKNIQEAVNDVRDAVSRVRSQMPSDMTDPIIARMTTSGGAILTYAVVGEQTGDAAEEELSWFVDNTVTKSLLAVPGVSKITRQGGLNREIRIELDPVKMAGLKVSPAVISSQLKQVQNEVPSGGFKIDNQEQSIRVMGRVASAEDLTRMPLPLPDGRKLVLGDVANVYDGYSERSQLAIYNGKPVVSFQVFRATGYGEIAVAASVKKALGAVQASNPHLQIKEISSTVPRVKTGYDSSLRALYEGSILAVVVVWLFLRNGRATLISATALPLSVLPTFGVMYFMGFTLNTLTFLSLTLIVGILVDDAIVEVENIVRHLKMGKSPLQAAKDAATEIGLAVVATSMTLVSVFLPTAFMGGVPGRFFKQFGLTAAVAVIMSLLVARLLTPLMAAHFMKADAVEHKDGKLMQRYIGAVTWCLANPKKTYLGAAIFLVISIVLVVSLPSTFMPVEDRGQISISVEAEPGTSFKTMTQVVEQVREIAVTVPEIQNVYSIIGAAGGGGMGGQGASGGDVRKASFILNIPDAKERERDQKAIEKELQQKLAVIPGIKTSFGIGASGEKMTIMLAGDNSQLLEATARKLETELRAEPKFGNISSSVTLTRPEIRIIPNWEKMAESGVTASAMGQVIRVATNGDYDLAVSKLNLPERQVPIRVVASPEFKRDLEALGKLQVPAKQGTVALEQIATLVHDKGLAQIDRYDRKRNVSLSVQLSGMPLGEASKVAQATPTLSKLPSGVTQVASGDLERMQELFGNFGWAMLAGVMCIFAVLVLLFHDFAQPMTILAALPLSAGGAFGALALFGYSLSMPALIGLLMLMGIVTKNSILLVEYAIMARKQGMERTEALIDACHKRAQPILMTTIAMIAGMLPLAMGMDGQSSFRAPMAIAVIGGLLTSTLLSLLVVPVVFEMIDELKQKTLSLKKHLG